MRLNYWRDKSRNTNRDIADVASVTSLAVLRESAINSSENKKALCTNTQGFSIGESGLSFTAPLHVHPDPPQRPALQHNTPAGLSLLNLHLVPLPR